ncbi:hypothetical protein H5V45_02575 [Nocardioides sp. KIGAM211]|uniref:Uncharacterized protein n=1 Tax=Nocardioides luti TaxID=2761101 RepID=A0A7X0RDA5_9ACTN|nr:hypothetical protein [Nocardioides luti]MBB6626197.1 hypothetical protein [Nocardioides luti]
MSTLHERLAALADEAPSALPETGLWERGRRYGRVRRAGTVAIALVAVLVLVGIAGVTWQQGRVPDPAPAGPAPGLPDRIWSPSPWLDGTEEGGPLGQLAALLPAARGEMVGSHLALVGISAETGDYRFLDLPDAAYQLGITDAALSPDGRHVAYWLTGTPSGAANPGSAEVPVVGVGLYDTTTGEVTAYRPTVEHGLMPMTLAWADADHLVVDAGQITESAAEGGSGFGASSDGPQIWTVGEPGPAAATEGRGARYVAAAGAGLLLRDGSHHSVVVSRVEDPSATLTRFRVPGDEGLVVSRALDATATRFATLDPGVTPGDLLAGPISDGGAGGPRQAQLVRVPRTGSTVSVLGWTDPEHVVTLRELGPGSEGMDVVRVTVPSGGAETLIRSTAHESLNLQLATDLLADPTVAGVEPPTPLDPRLTVLLGVLALGAGGLGLRWWRRRVRA